MVCTVVKRRDRALFFKNAAGNEIPANSERYRNMISNYFWNKIVDVDMDNVYFQQDGATSHTTQIIILLQTKFGERVILRNGNIAWPARSCDLTPMDFFLWGYLKSRLYSNCPTTIKQL